MSENTCGTCRFWTKRLSGENKGYCHRNAPRPGLQWLRPNGGPVDYEQAGVRAAWPGTHVADGCGEHEPKEDP